MKRLSHCFTNGIWQVMLTCYRLGVVNFEGQVRQFQHVCGFQLPQSTPGERPEWPRAINERPLLEWVQSLLVVSKWLSLRDDSFLKSLRKLQEL